MLGGAAFIFFAYIGFDAVSTTAEEARNPGKDLPFGIIMSLVICTILYIIVVAILNGMVPFYKLNVAYPVAFAMNYVGLAWAGVIISFGAIAGLTTVLLVMMFGQTPHLLRDVARRAHSAAPLRAFIRRGARRIFSTLFFGVLHRRRRLRSRRSASSDRSRTWARSSRSSSFRSPCRSFVARHPEADGSVHSSVRPVRRFPYSLPLRRWG